MFHRVKPMKHATMDNSYDNQQCNTDENSIKFIFICYENSMIN